MRGDLPLGRLAGIKVGLNWSVVFMAAVYTVVLAVNWLPVKAPGLSDPAYWAAGALGAVLFFVSLLVHEMGHALVAREEGIGVHSISLWMLGGMARLDSSPTTPAAEFRIAVVGPIGSAACGITFLSLAYALPSGGVFGLSGAMFQYLGIINLILAVFNMLPAAPLDGGTCLAATIWWRTGRQATGLTWSARVGVVVGAAMAFIGFKLLGDGNPNGPGLLAVGAFIALAAFRNVQAAPLYEALEGTIARDGMTPAPPAVPGSTPLTDFLHALPRDTTHEAFPVTGPTGTVSGLLTVHAVRSTSPQVWPQLRLSDLAYPIERLTVVRADEPLLAAVQKIESGELPQGLVVADDGTVVGLLRPSGIHQAIQARHGGVGATSR